MIDSSVVSTVSTIDGCIVIELSFRLSSTFHPTVHDIGGVVFAFA